MAVTFLARATARNELRKGAIVTVKPEWWVWGGAETLPDFIRVTVNGMNMREAIPFANPHSRKVTNITETSDFVNDVFTQRVESNLVNAANVGGITQAEMQTVIDRWALTFLDNNNNAVRFDADIQQVLSSQGFWRRDPTPFNLTHVSYDQGTGDHTWTADIAANEFNIASDIVTSRGGEIDDYTGGVMTFRTDRQDAKRMFELEVIDQLNRSLFKARFYFTESDVDQVVGPPFNGERTINRTNFLNAVQDEMA